jgi:restriction system protein
MYQLLVQMQEESKEDRGLNISSGGFTKEAGYEAERSKIPVTLLDLDDFVGSIVTHYEAFDTEGRALLPLVRVYWPIPS